MRRLIFLMVLAIFNLCVSAQTTVVMNVSEPSSPIKISRFVYGHFAEHLGRSIYDGFYLVDSLNVPRKGRIRLDIVEALKQIRVPVLRWPGGCFADEYNWRDGIGPVSQRPVRINTTWGMVEEDNSFGTQEFLELCELLNCEPYIAGNVGSGTPREMADWIEYLNFDGKSSLANERRANGHPAPYRVSFWGVGNENWGCGGDMTPEYYSDLYKRFAGFCESYPGAPLKKIACGPNSGDYNWMEVTMKNIAPWQLWGISLHYYTVVNDWQHKGSAVRFDEDEYFRGLKKSLYMEELIQKHSAIMDKYDPDKKVALVVDEWGIWTDAEPGTNPSFLFQQNSLRDALIAATTLNIFNRHSARVKMANLAQTVNVLQSLILTKKDKMVRTPTYFTFDLFKYHQDADLISLNFESPQYQYGTEAIQAVNASASRDSNGIIHITLVNLDPKNSISVKTKLSTDFVGCSGTVLTSKQFNDINTFEQPDKVNPERFNDFKKSGKELSVNLKPMSVTLLTIQ